MRSWARDNHLGDTQYTDDIQSQGTPENVREAKEAWKEALGTVTCGGQAEGE